MQSTNAGRLYQPIRCDQARLVYVTWLGLPCTYLKPRASITINLYIYIYIYDRYIRIHVLQIVKGSPGRPSLRPGLVQRAHPLPKPYYRVRHPPHIHARKKKNACMSQKGSLHTRKFKK
jgi:hypothetical protein